MESLKLALLLFDEVHFVDPIHRAIREVFMHREWEQRESTERSSWSEIVKTYDFLFSTGNARQIGWDGLKRIVSQYDGALSRALYADVHDPEFGKIALEETNHDYWGILPERIPPTLWQKEIWNDAIFDQQRFMGRSYIEGRMPSDLRGWRGAGPEDGLYMSTVAHDYFPAPLGLSISLNEGLIVCQDRALIPFSDRPCYRQLLHVKYKRALQGAKMLASGHESSLTALSALGATLGDGEDVSVPLLTRFVNREELRRRSIKDVVKFRDSHQAQLVSFRSKVLSLTRELRGRGTESADSSSGLVREIEKQTEKLSEDLAEMDDRLFVAIAKAGVFATPGLAALVLPGVPLAAIIALGCLSVGAIFNAVVKDIGELWCNQKKIERDGVSYLLELEEWTS
jgi:hypothetical protein